MGGSNIFYIRLKCSFTGVEIVYARLKCISTGVKLFYYIYCSFQQRFRSHFFIFGTEIVISRLAAKYTKAITSYL